MMKLRRRVMMPAMSGSEFLGRVRVEYPNTIRVLLTGQASVEAAIRAINEGEIYRFLTKPCDSTLLKTTIEQAIETLELYRQSAKLLHVAKHQNKMIDDLERDHPGISSVERTEDGAIVVPDMDFDPANLSREIEEALAAFKDDD